MEGTDIEGNRILGRIDPDIIGLTADSRAVRKGYLFAALPGSHADGRDFIGDAVTRGAVAVLAPREDSRERPAENIGQDIAQDIALITDDNPRRRFALIAARFYGAQPSVIVAVTGTNGKTSTAWFARQIWSRIGHRAASLGTLGTIAPGREGPPRLTTPDPVELHAILAELADDGVDHLALEASSHGLEQCRLDGVRIAAAAFTNLTHEHLDYHGTLAQYREAKLRLFDTVLEPGTAAVLNADSPEFETFEAIAKARGLTVLSYGEKGRDVTLESVTPTRDGQRVVIDLSGRQDTIDLSFAGDFQAHNALGALALVIACGEAPEIALAALADLDGPPGRLQLAARRANGAAIYVDYAHTPDALEAALRSLRAHAKDRLVLAFGCGGDRDAAKRPIMGGIAARLADRVIVTDDNPRTEDAAAIRRQIVAACPGALEIGDRASAIRAAIGETGPNDILIIAGKGHETGQIVGLETRPFDDVETVRASVAAEPEQPR